ncbi:nuclear pore complex protein DDB_G0274915-like [Macrobrachium nipponense]|uniref:nuclear pore complex protein DDB_G0274915-like n=1 Tax=Macrobrachium nipponense TaxID=159736 RepID=UPI0030C7AC13
MFLKNVKLVIYYSIVYEICCVSCGILKMDTDYENVKPDAMRSTSVSNSRSKASSKIYNETFEALAKVFDRFVKAHVTESRANPKSYLSWFSELSDSQLENKRDGSSPLIPARFSEYLTLFRDLVERKGGMEGSNTRKTPRVQTNASQEGESSAKSRVRRRDKGVMYLPVRGGGGSSSSCPSYADTVASSLTQMAFASMVVTVFNAVANIANNINNNNRNDNINSNSNIDSNNANVASNNNNANQVNIIIPPPIPPGRSLEFKRKRQQILRLKKISKKLLELQKARDQTKSRSSRSVKEKNGIIIKDIVKPMPKTSSKSAGLSKPVARPKTTGTINVLNEAGPGPMKINCRSRKAYARAALNTLRAAQEILSNANVRSNNGRIDPADKNIKLADSKNVEKKNNVEIDSIWKVVNLLRQTSVYNSSTRPKWQDFKSSVTRPKWQDFGNQTNSSETGIRRQTFNNQRNILGSDLRQTKTSYGNGKTTNKSVIQKAKSNDTVESALLDVCSPARHLCDSLDPQSTIDPNIVDHLVQMGRWRDAVLGRQRPFQVPSGTVTPGFTCLQVTAVCQS